MRSCGLRLRIDPVEFRKCARDLKALSVVKEYTNDERGGGRDPGVRRPGSGRGQFPARSKIFRAASFLTVFLIAHFFWRMHQRLYCSVL